MSNEKILKEELRKLKQELENERQSKASRIYINTQTIDPCPELNRTRHCIGYVFIDNNGLTQIDADRDALVQIIKEICDSGKLLTRGELDARLEELREREYALIAILTKNKEKYDKIPKLIKKIFRIKCL